MKNRNGVTFVTFSQLKEIARRTIFHYDNYHNEQKLLGRSSFVDSKEKAIRALYNELAKEDPDGPTVLKLVTTRNTLSLFDTTQDHKYPKAGLN